MNDQRREIAEAIAAADLALDHLRAARDQLDRAGGWGWADMLGGGLLTTFMKHRRIDDAREEMESAQAAVRSFAHELSDVDGADNLDLDLGDFLTFADYFFDGILADVLVQNRIDDAKRQVSDAIAHIERIRTRLNGLLR